MLHRCVATNRCCPKLHEEELDAMDTSNQANVHLYSNPYMGEEFSHPNALQQYAGQFEGGEFPPGAAALMYMPPMDQISGQPLGTDDFSEDGPDEWVQDVDDRWNMPKTSSADPGRRHGNPVRGDASGGQYGGLGYGYGVPDSMSWGPNGGRSQGVHTDPHGRSSSQGPATPRRAEGDCGDVQPEVNSRDMYTADCEEGSAQYAEPYVRAVPGRDAGKNSIEAIMACVQKAQQLPLHQRPNSGKWTDRWENMERPMF